MERGQAAQETIAALIIVLLVLALVSLQFVSRNDLSDSLNTANQQRIECEKISTMISFVNLGKGNDSITLGEISNDFNVSGTVLSFENTYCDFFGEANDAVLSKGDIRVSDFNGVATVENV